MARSETRLHAVTDELRPAPPFSLGLALAFLGEFPPLAGEQGLRGGTLVKATRIDGQTLVFRVTAAGSVEEPRLTCTLLSDRPIDAATRTAALDRIGFFLSVADHLPPFYAIGRADPAFAPLVERLYGYHQVKFLTPFESACWAVLSQRTSLAVARGWKARLTERFGGALTVDGRTYAAFPEPAGIAGAPPEQIGGAVGNARKAESIAQLAVAFNEVDPVFLRAAPYEEVEAWLRRIKGIGEWSSAFVLLRGLGRMERLPVTEEHGAFVQEMLRAARPIYGAALTPAELQTIAARYGDWRGYWAHYLRAAGDGS